MDGGEVVQSAGGEELAVRAEAGGLLRVGEDDVIPVDVLGPHACGFGHQIEHVDGIIVSEREHRLGVLLLAELEPVVDLAVQVDRQLGMRATGPVATVRSLPSLKIMRPASRSSRSSHEFSSGPP